MTRAPKGKARGDGDAAELAIAALGFLAADPERLDRFLALSGLGPGNLRRAAADPAFLGAVLEYIVHDETLLIGFARDQGRPPEEVARASATLAGPPIADP